MNAVMEHNETVINEVTNKLPRIIVTARLAIRSCSKDFRVANFFRQNMDDGDAKISHVSSGFASDLGEMAMGISRPVVVKLCLLRDTMSQSEIVEELPHPIEVDPWALAYMLELQGQGQDHGRLAVDGRDNIAFCPGIARNLWIVCFRWVCNGWVTTHHHSSEEVRFIRRSVLITATE